MIHPLNPENKVNCDQNCYTQKANELVAYCMEKKQSALQNLVAASFVKNLQN